MLRSVIYPVNEVQNIEVLAGILGWVVVLEHSQPHSWIPSGGQIQGRWSGVVENFEKRLASWQMQYLSMGGKNTDGSVLDSILLCSMPLHLISSKALRQLDKIMEFPMEGHNSCYKFHLVRSDKFLLRKDLGGLDIRDLALQNKCLRMKCLWKYTREDQCLCQRYEYCWTTGALKSQLNLMGLASGKSISILWEMFSHHKHMVVGKGQHISLRRDNGWLTYL